MKKKEWKQMTVRLMCIGLLTALFVLAGIPSSVYAAEDTVNFAGGEGTAENPYQVATAAHLNNVRSHLGSYFRLTANIDLAGYLSSGGDGYNEGAGWVPIGEDMDEFTGHFDGNGHTISGLYINRPTGDHVGLFGIIAGQATVKNLGLLGVNVGGGYNVGGLAGSIASGGQIENCYVTGAVMGKDYHIGGLTGNNYGTITNCYAVSAVTSDESDCSGVGGLVGGNFGTISACYAADSVTCNVSENVMAIGGLSGFNMGSISNCYATSTVKGGIGVGGLTGTNCAPNGNKTGTINYCYATGAVTGITYVGGLAGANTNLDSYTGTINHSFYDSETTGQPANNGLGTPLTTSQMKSTEAFTAAGWDFTSIWWIGAGINGGYPSLFWQRTYTVTFDKNGGTTEANPRTKAIAHGHSADELPGAPTRNGYTFGGWNTAADGNGVAFTAETPVIGDITVYAQWTRLFAEGSGNGLTIGTAFLIATPEHLYNMHNYLAGSYYFELTADIDLSDYLSAGGAGYNGGAGWEPIGTETASFDGHLEGSGHTISGLRINRPGSHNVGLFAYSQAEIRSLTLSNVHVQGGYSTGALAGHSYGAGAIIGCGTSGSMSGANYVGGLVGNNGAAIMECTATGTITGVNYLGGLTGYNAGTITASHCADGTVSGNNYLGGLTGRNAGTITTSHCANGTITGVNYLGGLTGDNTNAGTIAACFSSGSVTGESEMGGLVGDNFGTIEKSNSGAFLSGSDKFGGLVGNNELSGVITDCYAAGIVSGRVNEGGLMMGGRMGGLVGLNWGKIANCHASGMVLGNTGVGGLVGVSESDYFKEEFGNISNCYASGDVSGLDMVGGLVGENKGSITKSYATGRVAGSELYEYHKGIGGLAGSNGWIVDECYATGAVSGRNYLGGLVGYNLPGTINPGTVIDSFYDSASSGQSDTGKGIPKTTEEMKQQITFAGWDFTSGTGTWRIIEGYSNPRLQWEEPIYLVTFHARGGSATASTVAASSARITAPAVPTRTGYIFGGWYKENTCVNEWNFNDTVTGDITLYAKWTATPAVFTITADGGTVSPAGPSFSFDESITVTANSSEEGKKFAYWSIDGVKVSYNSSYFFYAAGDVQIVASYVDQGATVEQAPAVRLEARGIEQDEAGGVYGLSYIGQIVVPEGYILIGCGLVLINQEVSETDMAEFTIDGTINDTEVQKIASQAQTSTGQYMIVVHGVPADATRAGRAYLTYQKAGEPETTLYSGNLVKMVTPE